MHRLATICCTLVAGLVSLGPLAADATPAVDEDARPTVSLTPDVSIVGPATADERARVDDAIAAFRAAGLLLPDVEVRFDHDPAACNGHYGLFQERATPWRVTICSDIGFVMLHEFGHAWERANLDLDQRAAYAERRGFPTWNSVDFPREQRAAEEAAFVLQQFLGRDHHPDTDRWRDLTAAYDLLLSFGV